MAGSQILVVDDQPENLQLLRLVLVGAGYDVLTAASGEEALTLLQRTHPRLILMDVRLPGMDGLALTGRLKADPATRSIVVIAITAYAMVGAEAEAIAAAATAT